jgi:fengycin family lipopeptide synthetase B
MPTEWFVIIAYVFIFLQQAPLQSTQGNAGEGAENEMKLEGKVAIVTGGGRGIGRAIAVLFAKNGAGVTIAARTMGQIQETVEEIAKQGGRAIGMPLDVTEEEEVNTFVERVLEKFGHIDILVNNAGIFEAGPIVAIESETWRRVIEVNLVGTFLCSKAVTPHLIEQKWGRIINIASRSGKIGHPFLTAYCASKHGVVGFTKSLAEELAPFHITVNAICPGVVETDMVSQTVKEQVGNGIIMPEEIAELALYLASDDAKRINGEALNIFGNAKLDLSL